MYIALLKIDFHVTVCTAFLHTTIYLYKPLLVISCTAISSRSTQSHPRQPHLKKERRSFIVYFICLQPSLDGTWGVLHGYIFQNDAPHSIPVPLFAPPLLPQQFSNVVCSNDILYSAQPNFNVIVTVTTCVSRAGPSEIMGTNMALTLTSSKSIQCILRRIIPQSLAHILLYSIFSDWSTRGLHQCSLCGGVCMSMVPLHIQQLNLVCSRAESFPRRLCSYEIAAMVLLQGSSLTGTVSLSVFANVCSILST